MEQVREVDPTVGVGTHVGGGRHAEHCHGDRQRRIFSWALVVLGLICLVFTLRLVDERVLGPTVLVVLGLLLLWRRSR